MLLSMIFSLLLIHMQNALVIARKMGTIYPSLVSVRWTMFSGWGGEGRGGGLMIDFTEIVIHPQWDVYQETKILSSNLLAYIWKHVKSQRPDGAFRCSQAVINDIERYLNHPSKVLPNKVNKGWLYTSWTWAFLLSPVPSSLSHSLPRLWGNCFPSSKKMCRMISKGEFCYFI